MSSQNECRSFIILTNRFTFGIEFENNIQTKIKTMNTLKQISRILFCSLLLSSAAIVAQSNNNLIIFSETGDRFYLVLNGLKYNQTPETNVKVTNLNATNYKAKIIFENGHPDLDHNVYLMWEGNVVTNKEFTYTISRKGDDYKLKLVSQTDLTDPNANASNSVVYNANGTAANTAVTNTNNNTTAVGLNNGYNSTTTITTTTTTGTNAVGMNVNVDGMNVNVNTNGLPTNANVTTTSTTTTYSSGSTGNYNQNVNTQAPTNVTTNTTGGCASPMNEGSFNELVKSINEKGFEDAKLTVAKQAVSANCVSAGQVRKLMNLFSFEENKLALAKSCYDYTYDKQNYFKVNDGFSFDASVTDLNNYINSRK